jgi:hypothetical protein
MAEPAQQSEYEFSAEQNVIIRDLAGVMSVAGLVLMALAIVAILYVGVFVASAARDPTPMVFAAFCAPMVIAGFWVRRASELLLKIVDTEGSDITHLMTALAELRRIFALLRTGFAASLFIAVVGVVLRALQ